MTKAARIVAYFIAIVVGPAEWLFGFFQTIRHHRAATFGLLTLFLLALPHRSGGASGLPGMPWRQDDAGRRRPQHLCRWRQVQRQHSRQPAMQQLPCGHQGVSASGSHREGRMQNLPRRRSFKAHWQCALLFEGTSLHELSRQCPRDLSQGRFAIGRLPAQHSQDLRTVSQRRRDGHEEGPAQRLSALHGFDPRLRAEQGRPAGRGELPELPRIARHPEPQESSSPTFKANIPKTCGTCHAKINDDYQGGAHGHAVASGNLKAPVCTDCHTAHAILQPTESAFRMQSTPICGSCHKDKLSTYHDTFHSQLGSLGGYVETARCWDCHGAHEIYPASDPRSPVNKANLVKTCGRCHTGANLSFVQYQPHANAHDRTLESGSLLSCACS